MSKNNLGRFFEDYQVGQEIHHAVPRTISGGERALYHALYPARHAMHSSDAFAQSCGLAAAPFDDLVIFHVVFGKTVPDISLNAVANLGYAEGRFLVPVWPGDTLRAVSDVIGVRQNSSGKTGIVWVRTRGFNATDQMVIEYVRWVMVCKRDSNATPPETVIPDLMASVPPEDLVVPPGLDFSNYDCVLAGEPHLWGDYAIGEIIDHVDRVTVEEADHVLATRLWQNTAKVHFDATLRDDRRRLVYGGQIVSLARSLSFNGLAHAQVIVGLNAGSHVNPCFAGDTVCARSEVIGKAETEVPSVGALRLRLVAAKGTFPETIQFDDGTYHRNILLDMDYWALLPR